MVFGSRKKAPKPMEMEKKKVPRGTPDPEAASVIRKGSIKKNQTLLAQATKEDVSKRSAPINLGDEGEGSAEPFTAWLRNIAKKKPGDPVAKLANPKILACFPVQGTMQDYIRAMKRTGAPTKALQLLFAAFKKFPPFAETLEKKSKGAATNPSPSRGAPKVSPEQVSTSVLSTGKEKLINRQKNADQIAEERSARISAEVNKKKKAERDQAKRNEIIKAQAKMKDVMATRQAKVDEVEAKKIAKRAKEREEEYFRQNPYHRIGEPLPDFTKEDISPVESKHYDDLPDVDDFVDAEEEASMKDPSLMENIVEEPDYWSVVPEVSGDAKANAEWLSNASKNLRMKIIKLSKSSHGLGKGNQGYLQSYAKLNSVGVNQTKKHADNNKSKNRYGNISAYDRTRVILKGENDYINANWVEGENIGGNVRTRYIATQGPIDGTIGDFWNMVWQNNVEQVVMLTNEVESGKLKCHRYWPESGSWTPNNGNITIQFEFQENHQTYVIRRFEITNTQAPGEARTVYQYHYIVWPDHGVPETQEEVLSFRQVIESRRKDHEKPLLFHCSAGVGRTGTLIALDRIAERASNCEGELDVDQIVTDLRMSRNYMVQTVFQYQFVFDASVTLLANLLEKETDKLKELDGVRTAEVENLMREVQEAKEEEKQRVEMEHERRERILADAIHTTASADHAARVVSNFPNAGVSAALGGLKKTQDLWKMRQKKAYSAWKQEDYNIAFAYTQDESTANALAMGGRMQ